MTKREAITRALKKSQGLPLEMQAITVEMYLEVADELAPSCDNAALPQVQVGQWRPPGAVTAYHESRRYGCGGFIITEDAGSGSA